MKNILTFVIPVRHQDTAKSWQRIRKNLSETIASITNQDSDASRYHSSVRSSERITRNLVANPAGCSGDISSESRCWQTQQYCTAAYGAYTSRHVG